MERPTADGVSAAAPITSEKNEHQQRQTWRQFFESNLHFRMEHGGPFNGLAFLTGLGQHYRSRNLTDTSGKLHGLANKFYIVGGIAVAGDIYNKTMAAKVKGKPEINAALRATLWHALGSFAVPALTINGIAAVGRKGMELPAFSKISLPIRQGGPSILGAGVFLAFKGYSDGLVDQGVDELFKAADVKNI